MSSKRRDLPELAAEMLRCGNALRIRANGWSMYPFIKHGDILEVEPVEVSATQVGDIVLCRYRGDKLVAHRVVGASSGEGGAALVVKGDWTPRTDPLVYAEQVLGRVVAVERGEKRTRLNTGPRWLIEVLWANVSPYSRWLYFPLRKAVHASCKVRNRLRCLRAKGRRGKGVQVV